MDIGTALGGTSLAIQLYSACVAGYHTLQVAISQDAEFANLLCKLEIEEQRFGLWGDAAKIPTNDLEIPNRHLPTVLRTLECIEKLLSGQQKIIDRNDQSPSTHSYSYLPERVSEATDSVIRRLRWMMADRTNFEAMVRELKTFNDSLNSLLCESERLAIKESFRELSIRVLGTDSLEKLKVLRSSTAGSYNDICSLAALRCLGLEMEARIPIGLSLPAPNVLSLIQSGSGVVPQLTLPENFHSMKRRERIVLNRCSKLLEWKELPSLGSCSREKVVKRLQCLSNFLSQSLKPQDLRVLDLFGVAMSPDLSKWALVSSYPAGSAECEPTSLQEYLTSKDRHRRLPSLGDRLILALRLANCLLTMHTCGWLHKGVAPHNVLFFQPESDGDDDDPRSGVLREPFLVGFEYSREESHRAEDAAYSETMTMETEMAFYRHPSSQGSSRSKYKKLYDIYSLGLVLLDIALWKSTAAVCRNAAPREIRRTVIERYLSGDVAYRAGNIYQEVIKTCLTGDFGERGSEKNWLEAQFLKRVVHRLELCTV